MSTGNNLNSLNKLIRISTDDISELGKYTLTEDIFPYVIDITYGIQKYHIELDRKITVINDLTMTSKTDLCQLIANRDRLNVQVSDEVASIESVYDMIEIANDTIVYFIDENYRCLSDQLEKFNTFIKNDKNHLFVLVTRESDIEWLPYSPDDIFVLRRYSSVTYLKHRYNLRFYESRALKTVKHCYVEDSTTGLDFFRSILKIPTDTLDGKSGWRKVANEKNILLVIDRCGFGSCYSKLCEYIASTNDTIFVLDYESFEYMLLELLEVDIPNVCLCYNKEEIYEKEIKKYFKAYKKSKACKCCKSVCYSCVLFNRTCDYDREAQNLKVLFSKSIYGQYVKSIL